MAQIRFLGHAAVLISDKPHGASVVIDPFLSGNPQAQAKPNDLNVNYVLVTHAHGDHLGDAYDIANRNKALFISTNEIAQEASAKGLQARPMHIGGTAKLDFGWVKLVQAVHGSGIAGGLAAGFLLSFYGHIIYHAGDTALFGDMKMIGEMAPIEVAMLPIGGNYTMDQNDAVKAVELLHPATVVPIHYNTWPPIAADPQRFKKDVESSTQSRVVILAPGESLEL